MDKRVFKAKEIMHGKVLIKRRSLGFMEVLMQKHYKEYRGIYPIESSDRIENIKEEIGEYEEVELEESKAKEELLKVHSKEHYDAFLHLCKKGANLGDLNFHKGLVEVALNAINTSIKAAEKGAFAAIRPAGHHAYKEKFAGFCYFNNVVIAIQRFLENNEKIAIFDFDAHYGNGTHDLVKDRENVFYFSIHADTSKYYPGVKYFSKNSFLIDVDPSKENDEEFLRHSKKLIEKIKDYNPDVLAISSGFDTWREDKVLGFNIGKVETYEKLGEMIKEVESHKFALLEGGYHKDLGKLVKAFMEGLR